MSSSKVAQLPSFLIVGAMKAGTSTLRSYLGRAPAVWMLPHEGHFFDSDQNYGKGLEWYSAQFEEAPSGVSAIGDKCPGYCYAPEAAARIYDLNPLMKLIWILRDPADRAYSHYWHNVNRGTESRSFDDAVAAELDSSSRGSRAHGYVKRSRYADQIQRFQSTGFGKDRMLFLRFDALKREPIYVVGSALEFLGLSSDQVTRTLGHRKTLWRNKARLEYEPMATSTREKINEALQDSNQQLEKLTGLTFPES